MDSLPGDVEEEAVDGESSAPIFVVGANRSGTTLLRLILNAHSRIAIPDELVYFSARIGGAPLEQWRAPGFSEAQYARFVRRFLAAHAGPMGLDAAALEDAILREPPSLRRPYQVLLDRWAALHGKKRWGEKTPGNLFFVEVMLEMFPAAQFIYLARDPRAGVHSMNETDFLAADTAINAFNRRHYANDGLALLERVVPADQRMALRYEDLVARPEEATRAVCAFLGETYEPAMLHFHQASAQYMKERAAGGFNRAATRPIDASKVDAWKQKLSTEEVAVVETVCRQEMARFGYAPMGGALSFRGRGDLLLKGAYYFLQRWRHSDVPEYLLVESAFTRSRRRARRLLAQMTGT